MRRCREQAVTSVAHLPTLHPSPSFSGEAVSLVSGCAHHVPLQTSCFLKVADMIKDDQTSLLTITLCPRLAYPQFQLPHSGSINYYSNCFPQPTDSKLTACSSVLLRGGQRERGRLRIMNLRKETPVKKKNSENKNFLGILPSMSPLKAHTWFNYCPSLVQFVGKYYPVLASQVAQW